MTEKSSADRLYDVPVRTIDGNETTLRDFAGEVLLIVNVASECGLTPQYAGLQNLYETNEQRGFAVLGFPCNQFGAQEPGSNAEISAFCSLRYGVTFPLFDKIDVNGPQRHPLYGVLVAERPAAQPPNVGGLSDIAWNFEKFLVDRQGIVVARFSPEVTPDDPALRGKLQAALGEPR
ncbi:MAG: glutathione peroxidase [Candidatus Tumulicola sp.]